jgi:hypothetical protein
MSAPARVARRQCGLIAKPLIAKPLIVKPLIAKPSARAGW